MLDGQSTAARRQTDATELVGPGTAHQEARLVLGQRQRRRRRDTRGTGLQAGVDARARGGARGALAAAVDCERGGRGPAAAAGCRTRPTRHRPASSLPASLHTIHRLRHDTHRAQQPRALVFVLLTSLLVYHSIV